MERTADAAFRCAPLRCVAVQCCERSGGNKTRSSLISFEEPRQRLMATENRD